MITQAQIDEALDSALENGYNELIGWTPSQIAEDLICYHSGFEDCEMEELHPFISVWLASQ